MARAGPVLAGFHLGDNPYAGGQHRGIDIGGAAGSPVVAPRGGTVTFAGAVATSGLSVAIATADGYSVTLVHLGSIAVRRNAQVAEGAVVGTIGPTGVAAHPEPYVFLGVRISADPNGYLDPLGFLPPRTGATPPAPQPVPAPAVAPPPASPPPSKPSRAAGRRCRARARSRAGPADHGVARRARARRHRVPPAEAPAPEPAAADRADPEPGRGRPIRA